MSKIESSLRFAKTVYILGALFDALTLFPMLIPSLGGRMFGIAGFAPGPDYRYAMDLGAALMLGWTLLLVWGVRRPQERAGVLLLTVVVVAGLFAAGVAAVASGLVPCKNMLPTFVLQVCVTALFSAAYAKMRHISQPAR